jgi:hypothetical protein
LGAPLRTFAVALALLAPPVTHDVVPVYVNAVGTGFVSEYVVTKDGPHAGLTGALRVFRRPRSPFRDLLPADVQQQVAFMAQAGFVADPRRSRLLLAQAGVRIYGIPASHGQACAFLLPEIQMQCWSTLRHGATPVVDARLDVWGLLGDAARRVDVIFAAGTMRATVGANAFYLRLPAHVVVPERIVVRDRDGARHVYTIVRCHLETGDRPFIPVFNPLTPPLPPSSC